MYENVFLIIFIESVDIRSITIVKPINIYFQENIQNFKMAVCVGYWLSFKNIVLWLKKYSICLLAKNAFFLLHEMKENNLSFF